MGESFANYAAEQILHVTVVKNFHVHFRDMLTLMPTRSYISYLADIASCRQYQRCTYCFHKRIFLEIKHLIFFFLSNKYLESLILSTLISRDSSKEDQELSDKQFGINRPVRVIFLASRGQPNINQPVELKADSVFAKELFGIFST